MTSTPILLILILLIVGGTGAIFYVITNQLKSLKHELKDNENNKVLVEWLKNMKGSVDKNADVLAQGLKNQRETLERQLGTSFKVIQQVQNQLGGITEFGKDMKDLSNVLKSPKLRGGLGEQFLYEILENSLPNGLFKTQYKFKDGGVCDAVIKTDKGLIPIDSKFPMENFKAMLTEDAQEKRNGIKKVFIRDVKKRIDEISSKYILPDEGTTDFAVMYIPSENIYYELIVNTPEIESYARDKKVFMTSPNTLNYQVQAILIAYQQGELQKHAGDILKSLRGIKIEAKKFDDDLSVLSGHIVRTYKTMDAVKNKFGKLFGKIEGVETIGSGNSEQKPLLKSEPLDS